MEKDTNKKNKRKLLLTYLFGAILIAVFFLLSLGLKKYIFSNYKVLQSSMEPSFYQDDVVWVNKLKKPDYGDVILINHDGFEAATLIKRAVGFGGDLLWVEQNDNQNSYYLCRKRKNSETIERLTEEAYKGKVVDKMSSSLILNNFGHNAIGEENAYTVPENRVYCLGDNRNVSLDSRAYGAFSENDVLGVVVGKGMAAIWWIMGTGIFLLIVFAVVSIIPQKKSKNDASVMENADESS